jgi:hypothetical protein
LLLRITSFFFSLNKDFVTIIHLSVSETPSLVSNRKWAKQWQATKKKQWLHLAEDCKCFPGHTITRKEDMFSLAEETATSDQPSRGH